MIILFLWISSVYGSKSLKLSSNELIILFSFDLVSSKLWVATKKSLHVDVTQSLLKRLGDCRWIKHQIIIMCKVTLALPWIRNAPLIGVPKIVLSKYILSKILLCVMLPERLAINVKSRGIGTSLSYIILSHNMCIYTFKSLLWNVHLKKSNKFGEHAWVWNICFKFT